ncbi:disease resistance protein RPP13-like [Carex rostrata]
MWTAEGFIPCTASRTMEEAAEDCLDELVQSCMVEVSSRYTDGSIKYCRVHNLLRDLAEHEAEEDNFITVFSKGQGLHQPTSTRRNSLQFCSSELMKDIHPKTRSFLFFGELLPNFSEFRLLKVIHIESVQESIELRGLNRLINLKYLGFRNCKYLHVESRSFGRLLNLETLDLQGTPMEPHSSLWKIGTLRHVELSKPANGLTSSAKLENLQTLQWVLVLKTWEKKLPTLTNLRRLGLENPFTDWDTVTKVLTTLSSLVSLGLKGDRIPLEIVDMRPLPSYRNLQSLYLEGKWLESVAIKADLFPPHLIKLTFSGSMLSEDPLLELGKLENLKKL